MLHKDLSRTGLLFLSAGKADGGEAYIPTFDSFACETTSPHISIRHKSALPAARTVFASLLVVR